MEAINMRKVGIILIVLLLGMLLVPHVSAEKKTMYLDPGESGFYDFVELDKDTKVTYEWEVYQPGDDHVRFWIEGSDETHYVETTGDLSGQGTWTVPETGHYKIFWKNNNMFGTVQIDYEVTMKKPIISNTPGFGFVETVAVLGLVALSYFVKRREE
jgi:hypothetical protein